MSTAQPDDAAVREQAYLLWEAEGRPDGRANEYWMRARVAVSDKSQMDMLTKAPPKKSAKAAVSKAAARSAEPAKRGKAETGKASAAKAGPGKAKKQ